MSGGLGNLSRSTVRTVKNYTKGYSDVQTKVRAATSNDPWGPSGTQMNEIAQFTYNQQDFVEIMEMLDKRLNDKGKNWRHVFKALTVLDYCLHAGSENVVLYFRENLYIVKTLKEFQYIDEDGKDQGANVRQKAKDITNLLQDEGRLRDERKSRSNMRDRMSGRESANEDRQSTRPPPRSRSTPANGGGRNREDDELARALEMSKRSAEEEANNHRTKNAGDADLEEAMRLSREEDERRKRELENSRGGLFDQDAQNSNQLIDFSSANDAQPQPQFSSYNPYADAAAAMQRQQEEEYMRMQMQQQQQAEYQRQLELQQQQAQQQAQYQQMLQQQAYMQQMQQAQQQQQFAPQPLVPQQTSFGSNNPFASFASPAASPAPQPAVSQTDASFQSSFQSSYTPAAAPPPARSPVSARPQRDDGQHAKLAALIGGGGDGIDTFGNVGTLRVPVGSPFHPSNRVTGQATGLQAQQTGFQPMAGAPARGQFQPTQQPQQTQQQQNPFFDL